MAHFQDLIVCGAVRNAESALPASLETIDKFMASAETARSYIVTNDNNDRTDAILNGWAGGRPERSIIRLDGMMSAYPNRLDRLAAVRNFYLHDALKRRVSDKTILMVLDLDGPNAKLDVEGAIAAVNSVDLDWSALFANQKQAYYDLFPLRHPLWCPEDCWEQVDNATTFPFRQKKRRAAIRKFVHGRQYKIDVDTPPIEVDSAFGGLGIYKAEVLTECWYGSRSEHGKIRCDHYFLNKGIKSRGGRLFILPNLLNDAALEHLGPGSGAPFPYR
jgi:hypothetical protein